jgi:Uma2 family endonuclease
MSRSARKYSHISAAEHLAAENDGKWRHEFVNGAVYAMAGASERHNLIRGCLFAMLYGRVAQGCRVFDSEMKLHIKNNADERYHYPDVFVSRDPNDRDRYSRNTAVLIVEVLSPSTERIDRTEKFEAYKGIPSLLEYGLLTQDAVELELFRRRTDWQREFYQRDNTVTFESVGLTINVSSLYRDIDFDDPAPPPGT